MGIFLPNGIEIFNKQNEEFAPYGSISKISVEKDCFISFSTEKTAYFIKGTWESADGYDVTANFTPKSSPYGDYLSKINLKPLYIRRLQNISLYYVSLFFNNVPRYLSNMFSLRLTTYSLRGSYMLSLPDPKVTTFGLHSFSYSAAKLWNSLSSSFRISSLVI